MARDLASVARRTFRALRLRGYARVDMRLTAEGKLFVVEANPNPQIARHEDFAESAAKAGIGYDQLIAGMGRRGRRMSIPSGQRVTGMRPGRGRTASLRAATHSAS